MPSDQDILHFLNRPENFLYALDWRRGMCEFVPAARAALAELPFLDTRTLGTSRKKGTLPLTRVLAAIQSADFTNAKGVCDFIFHTSFCASTLLARLLDRPGKVLALKEPYALLGLSAVCRAGLPATRDWAEACLTLSSRPFAPGERTVIKPSNGANNLVPLLVGHPRVGKILILFGALDAFMVAVLGGGPARQEFVDILLEQSLRDAGQDPVLHRGRTPLERAAMAWGLQMRWFGKTASASGPGVVRTLDGEKLVADPRAALERVSGFFGYGYSDAEIAEAVAGPVLSRYAKDPSRPFDPLQAKAERESLAKRHASAIARARTFAEKQGFAFPEGLSNPLL
jgi:hypothetical protein